MDLKEQEQQLLGEYIDLREKMDKISKDLDRVRAEMAKDYHKETIGKCYINSYGDEVIGISYFTVTRVEYFDDQGRAKGTSMTFTSSGRQSINFDENIWHADPDRYDDDSERQNPFPADVFERLSQELSAEIALELNQFLKDISTWKTRKQDLTMSFWTRIQQVLSSTGLKLKPYEKEK